MNKFRKLGFIEYSGKIKVDKSLLAVVLHECVLVGYATALMLSRML
jgi:hypothetical protein